MSWLTRVRKGVKERVPIRKMRELSPAILELERPLRSLGPVTTKRG